MSKIPTLKQIYDAGIDVRDSYIPAEWKDSFQKYLLGSTYYLDSETKEPIYYSTDFRRWYYNNKQAIERDEKINTIL